MAKARGNKAELAGRVWQLMFDFLMLKTPTRQRSLQRRGLTANDSRALFDLNEKHGRRIGSLANQWGCDPSNATFIIDHLEKSGMAERRSSAGDRRVKLVALTERGATAKRELLEEFHKPPPELSALQAVDLKVLERILRKLAN